MQPGKAHGEALGAGCRGFDGGGGQRLIEPPLKAPPAAVKPRKATIGMAERAQGGGDAFNRGHQGFGRHLARLAQRLRGPCEEREHLEQFFGVAGGDAALRVHLAGAFGG